MRGRRSGWRAGAIGALTVLAQWWASSILIALFGLAVIPVNVAGIALLVLAAGLFAAELFTPGTGVAAVSGAVALADRRRCRRPLAVISRYQTDPLPFTRCCSLSVH